MNNVLVLKDIYNDFELYYFNKLKEITNTEFYYNSNGIVRKIWTHFGLPFEQYWYGSWKKQMDDYDSIIVFDSIHTTKLIEYIKGRYNGRIVLWHWNPLISEEDKKIYYRTQDMCEHWTFNRIDSEKYRMQLNNQFFFKQNNIIRKHDNTVFFVGTDKGRYSKLVSIQKMLNDYNIGTNFHLVVKRSEQYKDAPFECTTSFMSYNSVLSHISMSMAVLELVQEGQNGLTARALESVFFHKKLITNNKSIRDLPLYCPNNIFILGYDNNTRINEFLSAEYKDLNDKILYPYTGEGWIDGFNRK